MWALKEGERSRREEGRKERKKEKGRKERRTVT
jgi:hypothetical protein